MAWLAAAVEEPLVVGVAADHPVQDHDVVRLDLVRADGEVELAAGQALGESRVGGEGAGIGVVGVDQLQVRGPGGAASEQLELQVADTATDLEHAGTLHPLLGQELDHAGGGAIQAALAVPAGEVPREAGTEQLVVPAWLTATAHDDQYAWRRIGDSNPLSGVLTQPALSTASAVPPTRRRIGDSNPLRRAWLTQPALGTASADCRLAANPPRSEHSPAAPCG